jgi:DNA primase
VSFEHTLYGKIIEEFKTAFEETGSFPDTSFFVNHSDPSYSQAIASMISSPYELSHNWEEKHRIYTHTEDQDLRRTVFDPLMRLKLNRVKSMMDALEKALKETKNEDEVMLLLKEKVKLNRMKVEICKFFGSSII